MVSRAFASLALIFVTGCPDDGDDGGGTGTEGASTGTPATSGGIDDDGGPSTGGSSGAPSDSGSTGQPPGTTEGSGESGPDDSGGDSTTGEPTKCVGEFPAMWIDGTTCGTDPEIQIHEYDANTVILRQSLCTNFEGPFMYLLFGENQVLMQDTGAGGIDIADTVYAVIDEWLQKNGKESIELLVTNSHAHGDHVAGNVQFSGQPNTTVVGFSQAAVSAYFGIGTWPTDIVTYDLGGREIDVIPIPGHEANHIAIYDHATGWLMTGDTLYPGRLYIQNFPLYVESVNRLVDHTESLEVCHVMGTHIEMTNTPMVDFMFGATMHPDEHPLPLTRDHLVELRDAVEAMGNTPMLEPHDDFIIYPL